MPVTLQGDIRIRAETPADRAAVRDLLTAAFEGDEEARLVAEFRGLTGFDPALSLVAEVEGRVVGYILFTLIEIVIDSEVTDDGPVPALALAPMAVLPEFQRKGIGSQLANEGLQRCRAAGHRIATVLGHATYYPRFGFVRASAHGLTFPFDAPDDACMVLELTAGALRGVRGQVRYPAPFAAG